MPRRIEARSYPWRELQERVSGDRCRVRQGIRSSHGPKYVPTWSLVRVATVSAADQQGDAPEQARLVLISLILIAAVANLNLSVANVALPDIAKDFDSGQTTLNLVAVGYSLGLAVLGALLRRDRRPLRPEADARPRTALAVPACRCSPPMRPPRGAVPRPGRRWPRGRHGLPDDAGADRGAVVRARPDEGRSRCGRRSAARSPPWPAGLGCAAGALLVGFGLPRHAAAGRRRARDGASVRPGHVNETTEPVDHLGGVLSIVLVGTLILAINFAPVPDEGTLVARRSPSSRLRRCRFFLRQRRAANPLYDLDVAGAPRLLGRRVRRDHRLRLADGRDVHRPAVPAERPRLLDARSRAAILPAASCMVIVAPRSAKLVETRGARFTLLFGYVFLLLGFLTMLLLWKEDIPYWQVGLAYVFVGIGVGLAGTPASHSLTGSVPVREPGWLPARPTCSATWAARSCSRSSARCSLPAMRRPRRRDRGVPVSSNHRQRPEPADEVLRQAPRRRGAVPAVRDPDHRRRKDVVPAG